MDNNNNDENEKNNKNLWMRSISLKTLLLMHSKANPTHESIVLACVLRASPSLRSKGDS
jgi:hypothetical protein